MSTFDPYKILQVDPEADTDVVQAAYRRLASRYHPDRGGGPDAEARMVLLNRAWEIVSDPARRAELDRARRAAGGGAAKDPFPMSWQSVTSDPTGVTTARAGAMAAEAATTFTSGRSTFGSGYDPAAMGAADHPGAAGPPPGNASGPVLTFGRYAGWSLGEIARRDVGYLEWLDRMPIGRPFREPIDAILRANGRRRSPAAEARERRGLFRRR